MIEGFERAGLSVLERGWLSSNNVLLFASGDIRAVLVDSGYWTHGRRRSRWSAGLGGRRLDRIVNTHLHSDHCGGNAALQQAYACAIDVPAARPPRSIAGTRPR